MRGFELWQVSSAGQGVEPCGWHLLVWGTASVPGDPGIGLAPEDEGGAADLTEHRFDFCGIALVCLGELAVEADLPPFGEPGHHERLQIFEIETPCQGTLDVSTHHGFMNMRRQAREGLDVPTHMVEEVRPPGPERDNVHEDQSAQFPAEEEVGPKHRGAADIVGDDGGPVEAPLVEQGREDFALGI